jgi:hypothetical protein
MTAIESSGACIVRYHILRDLELLLGRVGGLGWTRGLQQLILERRGEAFLRPKTALGMAVTLG